MTDALGGARHSGLHFIDLICAGLSPCGGSIGIHAHEQAWIAVGFSPGPCFLLFLIADS
jgi:hypothetical protein